MIYILSHVLLLIKFIIAVFIKLFFIKALLAKNITIFCLMFLLFLLYKFPRTRFKKLSALRDYRYNLIMKYALKTKTQHLYNIIILILAFMFSFVFVFGLRYFNKERVIDLKEQYSLLVDILFKVPLLEVIINIILFILVFVLYVILIIKITYYFKYHIIKRHIWLIGGLDQELLTAFNQWYEIKFFYSFLYKIILTKVTALDPIITYTYKTFYYNFKQKNYSINYKEMSYKEQFRERMKPPVDPDAFTIKYPYIETIFYEIITKGHYMLFVILLAYDILFSNCKITLIFHVLPWIFFFELYLRISSFIDNLWLPHDRYLHTILYCNSIEVLDKDTLLINGDFYDYNKIKEIYQTYVKRGFIKDLNHL